jgi:hypothetical protein
MSRPARGDQHESDRLAVLARAGGGDQAALPRLRALLDETQLWPQLGTWPPTLS